MPLVKAETLQESDDQSTEGDDESTEAGGKKKKRKEKVGFRDRKVRFAGFLLKHLFRLFLPDYRI